MNRLPDVELVLRAYLADTGDRAPDRVLVDVAGRIALQPRRPWRLRGRPFMNTYARLVAAAAAVLVVGVVGWQLLPRNGGAGVPTNAPTPSAQPTSPATTPPPPSSPFPSGYPISGLLTPGSHATEFFQPTFTFTVPEGWIKEADVAEGPSQIGFYALFPDTPANRDQWARTEGAAGILIARLNDPYYFCDAWEDARGDTVSEIVAKITANEALVTTGLVDVEIGGLTGKQFDLRLSPDRAETCPGDPPGTSQGDTRTRSILLDVPGGGVLTMFIGTEHAADFEAHLARAMPVVESFEFELGQ